MGLLKRDSGLKMSSELHNRNTPRPSYSAVLADAVDVLITSNPIDNGPIESVVRLINHYDGEGTFTADELAGQFAWHIAQDIGRDDDEDLIGRQLDALAERGASFNYTVALDHALLLGLHYL